MLDPTATVTVLGLNEYEEPYAPAEFCMSTVLVAAPADGGIPTINDTLAARRTIRRLRRPLLPDRHHERIGLCVLGRHGGRTQVVPVVEGCGPGDRVAPPRSRPEERAVPKGRAVRGARHRPANTTVPTARAANPASIRISRIRSPPRSPSP